MELHKHPSLRHQVTWSRLKRPGYPAGYSKRDVKVFKRSLGLKKTSALIVSHNPQGHDEAVWWNFGGIENHHLVYSAGPKKVRCPECGSNVEHDGGCFVCRACGYSKCD